MFIMLLLASIDVNAQENDTVNVEKDIVPIDTTLHLSDVVVKAARVIHKVDRDIVLPSAKIKENLPMAMIFCRNCICLTSR